MLRTASQSSRYAYRPGHGLPRDAVMPIAASTPKAITSPLYSGFHASRFPATAIAGIDLQ
jgi:hypothetical protein